MPDEPRVKWGDLTAQIQNELVLLFKDWKELESHEKEKKTEFKGYFLIPVSKLEAMHFPHVVIIGSTLPDRLNGAKEEDYVVIFKGARGPQALRVGAYKGSQVSALRPNTHSVSAKKPAVQTAEGVHALKGDCAFCYKGEADRCKVFQNQIRPPFQTAHDFHFSADQYSTALAALSATNKPVLDAALQRIHGLCVKQAELAGLHPKVASEKPQISEYIVNAYLGLLSKHQESSTKSLLARPIFASTIVKLSVALLQRQKPAEFKVYFMNWDDTVAFDWPQILVPLWDEGHWSLLVVEEEHGRIIHYDTDNAHFLTAPKIAARLDALLKKKHTFRTILNMPPPTKSDDCGVFMLTLAKEICLLAPEDTIEEHMQLQWDEKAQSFELPPEILAFEAAHMPSLRFNILSELTHNTIGQLAPWRK